MSFNTNARRGAGSLATPVLALGLASGLVWLLEQWLGLSDASAAYLLAVVAVAVVAGTVPAIGTAVAAFVAYNFLFTHPRFSLIVADTAQLLNLVLLLVVGVVVGQLAGAQRMRVEHAEQREREARVLFGVSRALATRSDTQSALREIVDVLTGATGFSAAWVGLGTSPGAERPLTTPPDGAPTTSDPHLALQRRPGDEPARWMRVVSPVRGGRSDDRGEAAYRVSIAAGGVALGSLWALRPTDRGEPPPHETRMLAGAADQIGLALEQDRLRREAVSAELARESEALKSALLESVSHDLRTPLAAIRASAGALLERSGQEDPVLEERARAIDAEATRMNRLVSNLLDISRIEAGGLTLDVQPYVLDDLVATSLRRFGELGDRLQTVVPEDLPYVAVDAILLDQAVANVVENSMRYAPGSAIRVTAEVEAADRVRLTIEDSGPGVPDAELPRLFDKFYRVRGSRDAATRQGTGVGLAVVRGLVHAMGGEVAARRSELGGLAITLSLPAADLPPAVEMDA